MRINRELLYRVAWFAKSVGVLLYNFVHELVPVKEILAHAVLMKIIRVTAILFVDYRNWVVSFASGVFVQYVFLDAKLWVSSSGLINI
jgi:hypothetical protein